MARTKVDDRWYQDKVKRLGWPKIDPTLERLMRTWSIPTNAWERWDLGQETAWLGLADGHRDNKLSFLPTSIRLGYLAARQRAFELAEFHDMTRQPRSPTG